VNAQHRRLTELRVGESAQIKGFAKSALAEQLLEMGCVPGQMVTLKLVAPLGDPIVIATQGCNLSLRKSEAKYILVAN